MSEREHELHRRMTSLTERHRAWPRSWARTERAVPRDPFAGGVGSSPYTRGAPGCVTRDARRNRDHPRIRGEHRQVAAQPTRPAGIIPAYAGSTIEGIDATSKFLGSSPHTRGTPSADRRSCRARGDHPRIRGEHAADGADVAVEGGIIPACAGNTATWRLKLALRPGSSPHTRGTPRPRRLTRNPRRDHPRIRGEHVLAHHAAVLALGIIPAYAGNTTSSGMSGMISSGSSPHTRGTRKACHRPRCRQRDHPRIRGEHSERLEGQR